MTTSCSEAVIYLQGHVSLAKGSAEIPVDAGAAGRTSGNPHFCLFAGEQVDDLSGLGLIAVFHL